MERIPSNFFEFENNSVELDGHTLTYTLIGFDEGDGEDNTYYHQKVTVTVNDDDERTSSRVYSEKGSEWSRWSAYNYYEKICHQFGITPAPME